MLRISSTEFILFFLVSIFTLSACGDQEPEDGFGANTSVSIPNPSTPSPEPTPTLEPTPAIPPLPTTRPRRLSAGELQIAADIDDIPALFAEDGLFVDAEAGSEEWVDEELVIGVVINDDARAYPVRLLSNHEIVNDLVGGEPLAVTWCPLCFTAIVFDRRVDGLELTFGVSGYLYYNNLVMYDHRTNTLWSQAVGEGIRGAYRGERLVVRPSLMTSWGEWKAAYPETRVLSALALGTSAGEVYDPYAGYYTNGAAGVTGWANPNDSLPAKELVVGLKIGQEARAYPLALLREVGLLQDELAGVPLVLVYEQSLGSVLVYRREVSGDWLNFVGTAVEGQLQDLGTGTIWDVKNGRALNGPLVGDSLSRVAAPLVYWFAWSDLHTTTDLYVLSPE